MSNPVSLEEDVERLWHMLPSFVRDKWGSHISAMIRTARQDERLAMAQELVQAQQGWDRDGLRQQLTKQQSCRCCRGSEEGT